MRLRAHIERESVYRKRLLYIEMPQGIISIKSPSSVGFADSFCRGGPCRPFSVSPSIHRMVGIAFGDRLRTHPRGEAFWFVAYRPSCLPPRGRGTARNERWMREVSDYLMLPYSVTLLLQRLLNLGIVSQEVRRRSRSDPDHPVNGREGGERAA